MQNDLDAADLQEAASVIKCLGHPLRLRILDALEGGPKTVSALQQETGATQAAVSRQLGILRGRDVVNCRREGVNVHYWITDPRVAKVLDCIRSCGPR